MSQVFVYRYTEDGRTERLRPFDIHVRHCTSHRPILQCRLLNVSEMLWSPFFVVFVALQGVYISRKPQKACEGLTASFRPTTGVPCCRNLLPSWHCPLITFSSRLYGRGPLEVLRQSFCVLHWLIIHCWSYFTDSLSFVLAHVQVMLVQY